MKVSYKVKVKEPYILELSVDELIVMRFHLHEAMDTLRGTVCYHKSMSKYDETHKKVWKAKSRELRDLEKFCKQLELEIKKV